MIIRVKICGITRLTDALCAVEAGAHALGFVFYEKSPRNISLATAARICAALPPFVSRVGVFVNEREPVIRKTVVECGLDTLQFHGEETPAFCKRFAPKVVKAFRLRDRRDLSLLEDYPVNAWLLDAYDENTRGGTGKIMDWRLAVEARRKGRPIILSGGLHTGNVSEAIRVVQPYAVDVSSGVESAPGRKNPVAIRRFIQACRNAL